MNVQLWGDIISPLEQIVYNGLGLGSVTIEPFGTYTTGFSDYQIYANNWRDIGVRVEVLSFSYQC